MNRRSTTSARLFFAVLPDARGRDHASQVTGDLQLDAPARPVPSENFHVTIAFLGEVAHSQVAVVRQIAAAQRAAPFSLHFDAYEYWPKAQAIVAVAGTLPEPLAGLWRALHDMLALHRWAAATTPLRAHVTLARNVAQPPALPAMTRFDWPVTGFSLLRSDTGGVRSAYTVVDTWALLYDQVKT